ncbi:OprO/OprP family phosphate-selective porin [Parendozoicomonas haliclonae]|uniref:Porin O n=1 Tax=Parendozoicomonas haliclonae TaxID=1960125 RepID=A0A1X7AEM9_9GAMM|nr:porin [Parendozoicomonas haliclonae]SMA32775.1 Porin O precursor [Parendozoicomonas haliclonae]
MKRTALSLAVAAAMSAGLAMNAQAGTVKTEGEDIIISTSKGGFSAKTESGDFSFKVSGKLQWDYAGMDGLYNRADDGTSKDKSTGYIRRGEIKFSGKAYGDYGYALKLANDDGDIKLDNAYLDFYHLKPVKVRVGRFGPDFGLENSVSSSWITGIERPAIYDVLQGDSTNEYGIQASMADKQYTLSAGIHHSGYKDEKNSDDDAWGFNGRATVAPIMSDDMLVHLGANYYNSNIDNSATAAKNTTKVGVKKGEKVKLFNAFVADTDVEWGFEGAAQFGPALLQGEYFKREVSVKDSVQANADVDLTGYYVQASFMVDGGKRSYKKGAFGKPKGGQWEVFARYTVIDVDAEAAAEVIAGKDAEASDYTVGVNYFATKNVRASLNYVSGETNVYGSGAKNDDGSAVVGRIQYVF